MELVQWKKTLLAVSYCHLDPTFHLSFMQWGFTQCLWYRPNTASCSENTARNKIQFMFPWGWCYSGERRKRLRWAINTPDKLTWKESARVKQTQQEGRLVLPVQPRGAPVPGPSHHDPPSPLFPSSLHKPFLPEASQTFYLGWIYFGDAGTKF